MPQPRNIFLIYLLFISFFTDILKAQTPRTATIVVCACDTKDIRNCDLVADGTADNEEIQAAINSLPNPTNSRLGMDVGGIVLLSEGNFNIANTIIINRPRVVLTGQGKIVTRLDPINGFGAQPVIKLQGQNELEVKNLAITDPNPSAENAIGIDITSTTSTVLQNLWFGGLTEGTAIKIGSSKGAATGFLLQGIYIESSKNGIVIERESQNGRLIGIQIFKCINGLKIRKLNGASPKNISVSSSGFLQNQKGIIIDGASFLSLSNIIAHDNELYGIRLGATNLTTDISITGSIFQQNGSNIKANANLRTGVYIDNNSKRVTCNGCIVGNRIERVHQRQNYGFIIKGRDNRILNSTSQNNIIANVFFGSKVVNPVVRNTIGFVNENQGTAIFSSNGSSNIFEIRHNLSSKPKSWSIIPGSIDATGKFYVTANTLSLRVHFNEVPAKGSENIILNWKTWTK